MIYTNEENTLFLNEAEYEAVPSFDICDSCDLKDVVGTVCSIKCLSNERKDGKHVIWKKKGVDKMINEPSHIKPNPEEEMERKQLMETIRAEGDQLAKTIMRMEAGFPKKVLFVPKEKDGKVGGFELKIETPPEIQELIDRHTKRWQDMIEQHNKKFGLGKIMM